VCGTGALCGRNKFAGVDGSGTLRGGTKLAATDDVDVLPLKS